MNKKDLIIIQKQQDLIKYIYVMIRQFPRSEKFGLGNDIKQSVHETLRLMILANKTWRPKERMDYLNKIDAEVGFQKVVVRLAYEEKIIAHKKYFECEKRLVEIGNLLGGWMKATNKQIRNSTIA